MPQKTDRRIRKTRALLRSGLADLMLKKSLDEITVKELVDHVDINRSTFYLHYKDIDHMLHSIEDEIFAEAEQLILANAVAPDRPDVRPLAYALALYLAQNAKICAALLGPHGDTAFLQRLEEVLAHSSLDVLLRLYPQRREDLLYAYTFCLSGCAGVARRLLNGSAEEPEQAAARIAALVDRAAHGEPAGE